MIPLFFALPVTSHQHLQGYSKPLGERESSQGRVTEKIGAHFFKFFRLGWGLSPGHQHGRQVPYPLDHAPRAKLTNYRNNENLAL